jgi:hypothetical protein
MIEQYLIEDMLRKYKEFYEGMEAVSGLCGCVCVGYLMNSFE